MNQGVFHAIDFVLPDGRCCRAVYPAPISGMAAAVFPAVGELRAEAFIQLVPGALHGRPDRALEHRLGRRDGRPGHEGREYVCYLWLEGGWGGRPARKTTPRR